MSSLLQEFIQARPILRTWLKVLSNFCLKKTKQHHFYSPVVIFTLFPWSIRTVWLLETIELVSVGGISTENSIKLANIYILKLMVWLLWLRNSRVKGKRYSSSLIFTATLRKKTCSAMDLNTVRATFTTCVQNCLQSYCSGRTRCSTIRSVSIRLVSTKNLPPGLICSNVKVFPWHSLLRYLMVFILWRGTLKKAMIGNLC